ncbi:MAG: hypothetical protein AAGK04_00540 [Planctomycetota bacterium]
MSEPDASVFEPNAGGGAPARYGDAGEIRYPTPCRSCEYDLQGLSRDDACPECGLPTRASLLEYTLYQAGPTYVRLLRRSALALLVIVPTSFLLVVVAAGLQSAPFIATLLFACMHGAGGVAWVCLSCSHNDRPRLANVERARRRLRFVAFASAVPMIAGALLGVMPIPAIWASVNVLVWVALLAIRTMLALRFTEVFATAIPAPALARRVRHAKPWLIALIVLAALGSAGGLAASIVGPGAPGVVAGVAAGMGLLVCVAIPAGLCVGFVFMIYHIGVMEALHSALASVERSVRERAASEAYAASRLGQDVDRSA